MQLPAFIRRRRRTPAAPRPEIADLAAGAAGRVRPIQARYAAAGSSDDMAAHWSQADALDADAANSLAVRKRLRERSRLEQANNGYSCGMIRTQANYVVGRGPTLRMQTASPNFNSMVEARWEQWYKAVGFARKLRTMCRAKTGDGEGFLQIGTNPAVEDEIKLDLRPLECDQVTTPYLAHGEARHIDGMQFDEFGNPTVYEVLPFHPGGPWSAGLLKSWQPIAVPARFMLHWFQEDRPGQHRGVPEATSTLNLFGQGRRYREAVIAAAETAADFAAILEMAATNEGPDEARPFSTVPIQKSTIVASPAGAKLAQMKAEQPPTTYTDFNRSIVSEEARPLSMSYSIAACDSSGNSFSGTQNDHLIYYQAVDVEHADCELLVLDKTFRLWFQEAVDVYGWAVPALPIPRHAWDWPPMPQIDAEKAANADKGELAIGVPPSVVASRRGADFEDWVQLASTDYGVTAEVLRAKLFESNFQKAGAAAPAEPAEPPEDPTAAPMNRPRATSGRNGNSRRGARA